MNSLFSNLKICPANAGGVKETENKLAHKSRKARNSVVTRTVQGFVTLGKDEDQRHREPIRACVFMQDYAVTAGWDGTAKFWDINTGNLEHELRLGDDAIGCMVVHPHGDKLLTTNSLGHIMIWDITKLPLHVQILNIEAHDGLIYTAAFNSTGDKLVTGSIDKTAKIWDLTRLSENQVDVEELTANGADSTAHKDAVLHASFSPNGKRIATTSRDKKVIIWDTLSLNKVTSLDEHSGWVQCSLWYNNTTLLTGGNDKIIKVWDVPESGEIPCLPVKDLIQGHEDSISAIRMMPDGKHIVTAGYDQKVCFWDPSNAEADIDREDFPSKYLEPIEVHMDIVTDVNFSSDGEKMITSSVDCRAKVWSMKAIMSGTAASGANE